VSNLVLHGTGRVYSAFLCNFIPCHLYVHFQETGGDLSEQQIDEMTETAMTRVRAFLGAQGVVDPGEATQCLMALSHSPFNTCQRAGLTQIINSKVGSTSARSVGAPLSMETPGAKHCFYILF